MRKQTFSALILLVALIVALAAGPGAVSKTTAQGAPVPAHLVLSVDNGADARMNRSDWDVNAFSPLLPGAGVRAGDYIDLSGRTTVKVLCADLQVLDQRGSEAPRCNPAPADAAFFYADDPAWTMRDQNVQVMTLPADLGSVPAEIDPGGYSTQALGGGDLDTLRKQVSAIQALNLPDDAKAFALSNLFRSKNALFNAVGALTSLPDIGCTARRPTVDAPSGDSRPMAQSPVLYLRLGELYEMLGRKDDATRNYQCAVTLANGLKDQADEALASVRWANLATDPGQATQFYQQAINDYAALGAKQNVQVVLNVCGARNCTSPQ